MKLKSTALLVAAGLLALPSALHANIIVGGHYPAGAEGLKGATLPPPGLYFRDYTIGYRATDFPDGPPVFDLTALINAPRIIWISEYEILGANWGMDLIVPFGYMDWRAGGPGAPSEDWFGIGDIQFEPVLLSWHSDCYDLAAGYAVWAPTGDFKVGRPDLISKGFWSHMLTLGRTYYFDQEKSWALSLLTRYEFCHEQQNTNLDPGQVFTLEWGLSKSIRQGLEVGLTGYWQKQTTGDDGAGASLLLDEKIGIGAEVSAFWPRIGAFTSLRYVHEFDATERPEGDLVTFTFTKPL